MPTQLIIYANTDDSIQDLPLGTSGVEYTAIDSDNDKLIITNGTVGVVDDGEVIPGESELNQAGFVLQGIEIISEKHFIADASANELKEVHLMGNIDAQHVLAFDFDGPTASEPVLEIWDDSTFSSIDNLSLGAGIPSNSWFRGITTTNSSSGLPGRMDCFGFCHRNPGFGLCRICGYDGYCQGECAHCAGSPQRNTVCPFRCL